MSKLKPQWNARWLAALRSLVLGPLLGVALCCQGSDWPQYRGPTTDGISTDPIQTNWVAHPPVLVWTNGTLTNGFSSFAVSQGRAFTLTSQLNGSLPWSVNGVEYCTAVDAATGSNLWATPVGPMPLDPTVEIYGGDGISPYYLGDGPRTTPAVAGGNVLVLSATMSLVCLNATNGSVVWSNNLKTLYNAQEPMTGSLYKNASSPIFDNDLVFLNLNSTNGNNCCAFRVADGSRAWATWPDAAAQCSPAVVNILGTRQVLFATVKGIAAFDRTTGTNLWSFLFPWGQVYVSMGATPLVYSNIVFATSGNSFEGGSTAYQIAFNGATWSATRLWFQQYPDVKYQSAWMTPVIYQGYVYGMFANTNYLIAPLNCMNLSTSNVVWSTNNFGLGGTILVNNNVLALTEDGQLVLVQPNPAAYTELGRFRIFSSSTAHPGKCWNSPAYSNGRIYARSTQGGVCVDVSVPPPPPLQFLAPQFSGNQFQLVIATTNGTPIDSNRLAGIQVHASGSLAGSATNWPVLTNPLALLSNGTVVISNVDASQSQQFYITVEQH